MDDYGGVIQGARSPRGQCQRSPRARATRIIHQIYGRSVGLAKIKDIVVKVREYQDNQGNKKAQWANVGSMMRGDDGNEFILLDRHFSPAGIANPDNRGNVLLSMFDPKPRDGQQCGNDGYQQQGGAPAGGAGRVDMDDEIPFAPCIL